PTLLSSSLFVCSSCALLDLHSFPTRRSSDLPGFQVGFVLQRVLVQDLLCRLFQAIHDGDAQALLRHGFDQNALCPSLVRQAKGRSEEHTSELQSRFDLVCRLLLEKKKKS